MGRGSWQSAVHGITKSRTQLSMYASKTPQPNIPKLKQNLPHNVNKLSQKAI